MPKLLCAGLGSADDAESRNNCVGTDWRLRYAADGVHGRGFVVLFSGYAPSKPTVQARWYLLCTNCLGCLNKKGPVGIVLPALIIGSFLLYLGNALEVLREMRVLLGLLVLAIALPWYVLVIRANGWAYINSFLAITTWNALPAPLITTMVPGITFQWCSWALPLGQSASGDSTATILAANTGAFQTSHQLGLFALFWFIGVFGFFTIAVTKLPNYVLPLMPAAAILVALLWSEEIR